MIYQRIVNFIIDDNSIFVAINLLLNIVVLNAINFVGGSEDEFEIIFISCAKLLVRENNCDFVLVIGYKY